VTTGTARQAWKLGKRQGGQAIAEYVYVFPIMLLLVFGAIQFGFIYQAKSTLNYATFVATRQGALNNGKMDQIVEGLTSGLMPLFTHDKTLDALKKAYTFANAEISDSSITQVTIVNPTPAALNAYSGDSQSNTEIPNDNLMYRRTAVSGLAGMSIQDANLLKVRVTYCLRMVVPVINRLIYLFLADASAIAMSPSGGATSMIASDSTQRLAACNVADEYRIPITAEAVVRMQTPFQNPGKWVGP
jgi:Flp pilus assembly protein TadG